MLPKDKLLEIIYTINGVLQLKMDTSTKDSIANLTTLGGISLSMAQIQTTISVLVLITALLLNISRLYDWWKQRGK